MAYGSSPVRISHNTIPKEKTSTYTDQKASNQTLLEKDGHKENSSFHGFFSNDYQERKTHSNPKNKISKYNEMPRRHTETHTEEFEHQSVVWGEVSPEYWKYILTNKNFIMSNSNHLTSRLEITMTGLLS